MSSEPTASHSGPSFHLDAIPEQTDDAVPMDESMAILVHVLDLQAALPGIRRIRRWGHDALAVLPGEHALDVGAGTGSEVVYFADLVGAEGEAVGVEPNPAIRTVARARADAAGSRARFVEGSAYHLPFPDDSFDAVRCERVYQHLDRPEDATAEIARVLRPGGRVLLVDSDWHTAITHPGDPDVLARLTTLMLDRAHNATSGRRLRGLLARAGFAIDDLGSEAVVWDEETTRPMFTRMAERGVSEGTITEQERLDLLAAMEEGLAAGDYHLSVTMFAVLAHLPTTNSAAPSASV